MLSWAVELRNPYIDALCHLQLRALRALRSDDGENVDRRRLEQLLLLYGERHRCRTAEHRIGDEVTSSGDTTGPPMPARHPVVHRAHGDERVDEYAWLRDRDNPAVMAHLEAENAWTERVLEHLGPLRERVYAEIVSRVQQSDSNAPARHGPYSYYTRTIEGRQYYVHCRRRLDGGDEEILLDENALAEGHEYFNVGDAELSSQ